jgi:hypothetical protein
MILKRSAVALTRKRKKLFSSFSFSVFHRTQHVFPQKDTKWARERESGCSIVEQLVERTAPAYSKFFPRFFFYWSQQGVKQERNQPVVETSYFVISFDFFFFFFF